MNRSGLQANENKAELLMAELFLALAPQKLDYLLCSGAYGYCAYLGFRSVGAFRYERRRRDRDAPAAIPEHVASASSGHLPRLRRPPSSSCRQPNAFDTSRSAAASSLRPCLQPALASCG